MPDETENRLTQLDLHHRMLRINRAMAECLGKNPADLIGHSCFRYMHESEASPDFCPHSQLVQDRCEHSLEVKIDHLDRCFDVSGSLRPDGWLQKPDRTGALKRALRQPSADPVVLPAASEEQQE